TKKKKPRSAQRTQRRICSTTRARSGSTWKASNAEPSVLTRKHELSARVPLPYRKYFSVLDREGNHRVGEFLDAELVRPPGLEVETAGASNRKALAGLERHVDLCPGRRQVASRVHLKRRVGHQRRGYAACERHRGFVQRDIRALDLAHRIGPEVERELAVLFVVGGVEAVVVEVVERHLDAVELEPESRVATRHGDDA